MSEPAAAIDGRAGPAPPLDEDADAPLLPPTLLARLEHLQLGTRRRLAGRFSGEHRSVRQGDSVDYVDAREYHSGDDYRRIDYPLWARTDQLFIKLFEAEDDLTVRLMIDTSASMGTGGKLRQAARLAAALGFVALTRRDVVEVHLFPPSSPPRRFAGRGAAPAFLGHLDGLVPGGPTDVVAATMDLLAWPGPRGVTVLCSDLLTEGWAQALDRLPARGGDLVIAHVVAPEELAPDLHGDLDLVDSETGERVPVSLSADSLARYVHAVEEWMGEVAARAQRAGAAYLLVRADDDVERLLLARWRQAGVLR